MKNCAGNHESSRKLDVYDGIMAHGEVPNLTNEGQVEC